MTFRTDAYDLIVANIEPLGYPVSYPGLDFDPPGSGIWLEVAIFESDPDQYELDNSAASLLNGFVQVTANDRPGRGEIPVDNAALQVIAALPKGTRIGTHARVNKKPYRMSTDSQSDRLVVPVTIPYGP